MRSTIDDGNGPGVGPSSRYTATDSPSCFSASSAVVAAACPDRFADDTANGPVRPRSSNASSWSGIRTATVPSFSPRSQTSDGCSWHTIVNGPGQNAEISARPASGTDVAMPSSIPTDPTSTGGGICRPLPFAANSPATAGASNASAAIPYTVSVGRTTRSPRRNAVAAASSAASRSSGLAAAQSYRSLTRASFHEGPTRCPLG